MDSITERLVQSLLALFLLFSVKQHTTATHFRGVHMWWDSTNVARQADIYYRVAWRRTYRVQDATFCDMATIQQGGLIGPPGAGYITCAEGCTGNVGNLQARCTDYSASEDWVSGIGNHTFTLPSDNSFAFKWQGVGWLAGVNFGEDAYWSARMTGSLSVRSDTGRPNSSPRSAVPPVLRLQHGCQHTITIPVLDPDSDVIRCRWARSEPNECGGICGTFTGADLDQETCTITYTADKETGYYAAAIQIEDYRPDSAPYITPLSSIPLQFLLLVYSSSTNAPCDAKPQFLPPTPEADTCLVLQPGSVYSIQVVLRTKDEHTFLDEVNTVSSAGMYKTEVFRFGSDRRDHYVNITWTPSDMQMGESVFCFSGLDSNGESSEQRCIYQLVTESSKGPQVKFFSFNKANRIVSIQFDQNIKRSTEPLPIYVHSASNGAVLLSYDVNDASMVTITNDSLSFVLPESYTQSERILYIRLSQGVVVSTPSAHCTAQSEAINDANTLRFSSTAGVPSSTTTPSSITTPAPSKATSTPTGAQTTTSPSSTTGSALASGGGERKNYTWLIVTVVVLVLLLAVAIVIAVLVRWRQKARDKYSREQRQEQYARTVASKMATNGAYQPDFNDIDVKFR